MAAHTGRYLHQPRKYGEKCVYESLYIGGRWVAPASTKTIVDGVVSGRVVGFDTQGIVEFAG